MGTSNILTDLMEYLGAGGPVVNSPSVTKGITTLAINLDPNFDRVSCVKEKKSLLINFHVCQRKEKYLTNCHASKKGKKCWQNVMYQIANLIKICS